MNARWQEDQSGVASLESPRLAVGSEGSAREDRRGAEGVLDGEKRVLEMIAGCDSLASIQDALRRSQAYLAEAQRLSRTGSFGWNVATGELIWSAETFCILGYDRAQKAELGMVLRRVHPEDLALVQQMIHASSREGTSLDFEHRLLMPDGSVKHLHVIAHPVRNSRGEVEFVGAVMDVTGRKRAEALVAGEKRLLEMIARGVALRADP